jgi:hypothetical protein
VNNRIKFAQVFWTAEDIHELRPDWTDEQCEEFLGKFEEELQDRMIEEGWETIEDALKR